MSAKTAVVNQAVAPAREGETSFKRTCECGTHTLGGGPCAACCAGGRADGGVPSEVYDVLRQSGRALDGDARSFMESKFGDSLQVPTTSNRSDLSLGSVGDPLERDADSVADRLVAASDVETPRSRADFSRVRVHTGPTADAAAAAIRARAFSVGGNIVFRAGEYRPGTARGNRLIAHELAHMGQTGAATVIRRKEADGDMPAIDPNSLKIPPDMRIAPAPNEKKTDAKAEANPPDAQSQAAPRVGMVGVPTPPMPLDPALKAKMPPVDDALKAGTPAPKDPKPEEPPKSISDLSTGSLDFIDYELAEHERWGSVGKAGSADRALFVAKELGKGVLRSVETVAFDAGKGHVVSKATDKLGKMAQSGLEKWAKELGAKAEDFKALGSIGAVIGGAMAAYDLATRDWKSTGETIGKFGQGADIYEKLANDIDAISTIVEVASDVLKVIAGIIGAISIAIWAITIITVGVASPLAGTLTTIALFIVKVTMVLDKLDQVVLKQLITIFRALHTFYSDADPRDVVEQGQTLEEAAKGSASAIGGFLASKAEEKLGHSEEGGHGGGKKGSKKVPDHPDPPPASGAGPTVTGNSTGETAQATPHNVEPISATAKPRSSAEVTPVPAKSGADVSAKPAPVDETSPKAQTHEAHGEAKGPAAPVSKSVDATAQKVRVPAAPSPVPIPEPLSTDAPKVGALEPAKPAMPETVGKAKKASPPKKTGETTEKPTAVEHPVDKSKPPIVDKPAVPASLEPELKQVAPVVTADTETSKQSMQLTDDKPAAKVTAESEKAKTPVPAEPVKPAVADKSPEDASAKKPAGKTKKPAKPGPGEEGPLPDKAEIVGAAYLGKQRLEADWHRVPVDDQIRLMGKGKAARDQHEARMDVARAKAKALGLTDEGGSKARTEFMEKEESDSRKILNKELGDLNEERTKIQTAAIEADKKGTTPKAKPLTPQEEAEFEKNFPKDTDFVPPEGQKIDVKEYQMKFPKMVEKGVTTERETGLTGPYKDQPKAKGSGQEADHIIASSKAKLMNPLYNEDPALTTDIPEDVHDVKTFQGEKSDVKEAIRLKDLAETGKGPSTNQVFTDSVNQLHFAIDEAAKNRALAAADVAKLPPETHKLLSDMAETAAQTKKSAEDKALENHTAAIADIEAGKTDSTAVTSDVPHQEAVKAASAKRLAAEAKATSERDTAVKAAKDNYDNRAKIAAENRKALDEESPKILKAQVNQAAAKRDKALSSAGSSQKDAILKTYEDDVKRAEALNRRRLADHIASEKEYVGTRAGKILADATESAESQHNNALGAAAGREKNDLLKANDSRRDRALNEAELNHRKDLDQIRQRRLEEVTKLKAAGKGEPGVKTEPADTAEPLKTPEPVTPSPVEKSADEAEVPPIASKDQLPNASTLAEDHPATAPKSLNESMPLVKDETSPKDQAKKEKSGDIKQPGTTAKVSPPPSGDDATASQKTPDATKVAGKPDQTTGAEGEGERHEVATEAKSAATMEAVAKPGETGMLAKGEEARPAPAISAPTTLLKVLGPPTDPLAPVPAPKGANTSQRAALPTESTEKKADSLAKPQIPLLAEQQSVKASPAQTRPVTPDSKKNEAPLTLPYRRTSTTPAKKTESPKQVTPTPQPQEPKKPEAVPEDQDDDLTIAPPTPESAKDDNPIAQMGKQLGQLKENVTGDKTIKARFMEGFDEAREEGAKQAKPEAITEHVYPDYPPLPGSPPISPQTVVDVQNQILSTLDARAEAEDAKARMSIQANHHTNNKEPLSKVKAKSDDVLNARGAHEAAVRRRQEANGKKQGSEGDAGSQLSDYEGSKATIQGILVPMRFFARFTGLASSLPDSPDVLVGAKNGILRMSAKTKEFVSNLESVDKSMTAQKTEQADRLADTKKDATTLEDTKSKSQDSQTSLEDTKDKTESINKENDEKAKQATDISGNAAKASSGLDKQAQEKTAQAQSLAAQLEAWAQSHRQARLDAIAKKKKEMADRGLTNIQGAER